jgi:hypothetical protein
VDLIDGGNISGSRSATLTMSGVRLDQTGAYAVRVSNSAGEVMSADAYIYVSPLVELAEATEFWEYWTTSGSPPWFGQKLVSSDGEDAAQSGAIANSGSTSMQTTIAGPGTLRFVWKVSSEPNNDTLRFYVNGSEKARISGEVDWQLREFPLGSGDQTLKWTYRKNSSSTKGLDRGWVDQIQFIGAAPAAAAAASEGMQIQIRFESGAIVLQWASKNAALSRDAATVLYTDSLASADWKPLPSPLLIEDGVVTVRDSVEMHSQRFYRIVEK